jgi:hypothetical protein
LAAVFAGTTAQPSAASPTTQTIFSFPGGSGGAYPEGGVLPRPDGSLYVSTDQGGSNENGVIYSLAHPSAAGGPWAPTILHVFAGGAGGGYPLELTAFGSGLVGTALDFGAVGYGLSFALTPPATTGAPWRFSVPHAFAGTPDGAEPSGPLVQGGNGVFYGTTSQGGGGGCTDPFGDLVDCGVVYALSPPSAHQPKWQESVIFRFQAGNTGHIPIGRLLPSPSGGLYGVTTVGGQACGIDSDGCGVIFELTPPAQTGAGWTEHVLYRFYGSTDGGIPEGSLVADEAGALYGTTGFGGNFPGFDGDGYGTVFRLTPPTVAGKAWAYTVLYRFKGAKDGFEPQTGLLRAGNGSLAGTTYLGGPNNLGTLFALVKSSTGDWQHYVLHGFGGPGDDGAYPLGPLSADGHGHLFGVTYEGGTNGLGTVFMVNLQP